MRLVLGLSLTASSAVWVLVDTDDGRILAEEVVELESLHEIARTAALSVQALDSRTEYDIEAVRLTWTDDAYPHGVRLRTKLRLFGFEPVETVPSEAARAGRNKTARHLAPHLALAYGAARADRDADGGNVLRRFASRAPLRGMVAASGAAAVVVSVGLFAFEDQSPSVPAYDAAAEPAAARTEPQSVSAPKSAVPRATKPASTPTPARVPEPVPERLRATGAAAPANVAVPELTTEIELDSTVPVTLPATIGVPHLSHAPAQAAVPVQVPAETGTAVHGAMPLQGVGPVPPAPAPGQEQVVSTPINVPSPLPPPLSRVLDALP